MSYLLYCCGIFAFALKLETFSLYLGKLHPKATHVVLNKYEISFSGSLTREEAVYDYFEPINLLIYFTKVKMIIISQVW